MTNSASPWKDVTGVGNSRRPSATDLGRGSTTKEEEALIKALMGPRAKNTGKKVNKFSGKVKEINNA